VVLSSGVVARTGAYIFAVTGVAEKRASTIDAVKNLNDFTKRLIVSP
jgi:hypothetical protein